VGEREAPVNASPLDVPEIDTPLVEPLDPVVPVEEDMVAVVALPRAAPDWANAPWAMHAARAPMARKVGLKRVMEVSRFSG